MASQISGQEFVRRINTSIVLDCIRNFAPLSRAEISARAGCNRSTISSIVGDLIAAGFVVEAELEASSIGRPDLRLTLKPLGGCVVSLDIGVDFLPVL
ncbi:MAG: MarR family transcriptional regulator [Anaerolineae bacterium]|nr:MarR family transcriptional regulator [Anaerolineae bacterium]